MHTSTIPLRLRMVHILKLQDAAVAQRIEQFIDEEQVVSSTLTSRIYVERFSLRQTRISSFNNTIVRVQTLTNSVTNLVASRI